MWHHLHLQDITSWLFDLKPPFWGHHTHYIRHVHCICVISPTLSMISQPLWYHIQYIWDILSTIFMISYALCMTSQPCVLITPHSICMTSFALQKMSHPFYHTKPQSLWLHNHLRHDITPTVSDVAPTVSLSSQTLHWYHKHFCMTSHPLYLWQHMHYI